MRSSTHVHLLSASALRQARVSSASCRRASRNATGRGAPQPRLRCPGVRGRRVAPKRRGLWFTPLGKAVPSGGRWFSGKMGGAALWKVRHLAGRSPIPVGDRPQLFLSPSALHEARASAESRGWEGVPPAHMPLPQKHVRPSLASNVLCGECLRPHRRDRTMALLHVSVLRVGQAMISLSHVIKGHVALRPQRSAAHPLVRSPLMPHIPAQHTCDVMQFRLACALRIARCRVGCRGIPSMPLLPQSVLRAFCSVWWPSAA